MFPYPLEGKHLLTGKRSFTRSDVFFRTVQKHVMRLLSHLESRKLFFDIVRNQVKHELKGGKDIIQQLLQAEPREKRIECHCPLWPDNPPTTSYKYMDIILSSNCPCKTYLSGSNNIWPSSCKSIYFSKSKISFWFIIENQNITYIIYVYRELMIIK